MNESLLKGAKHNLINALREKNIANEQVLQAFDKVDRHLFLQETFLYNEAYQDKALPIGCGQTISAPSTVAFQTQLLEVSSTDRIMEIGTGSGFQAAILFAMGAQVYTIERQADLFRQTKSLFERLRINPAVFYGDGFRGLPQFAPFEKIIVTCGAPHIPENLLKQLKINGIMVIPVGDSRQTMKRIVKTDETSYKVTDFGDFNFVPMLQSTVYLK
ncbi:MAG: protein-L-isoaspartate(D-aspartate) O-methyltransferase [Bacteroidales bacterium]|nr:protein-L-isoaspartate(D-aspartate) O-methyltransferase [Bacteroidales bacterium]